MATPLKKRPARRRANTLVDTLQLALFLVAFVCLAIAGWTLFDAWRLDRETRLRFRGAAPDAAARSVSTPRLPRVVATGDAWGRVELPRLSVSAAIVEGTAKDALGRAVGHVVGTPFPEEGGNVVLAGHRDTHFSGLRDAEVGDEVRVVTADETFVYRVDSIEVVEPHRVDVMDPTPTPHLTLITCYPFNYIGAAPYRFVIRAAAVTTADEDPDRGRGGPGPGDGLLGLRSDGTTALRDNTP